MNELPIPRTPFLRAAINLTMPLLFVVSLMLLGCMQNQFEEADLVGRWKITDPTNQALLVLSTNKLVIFQSVNAKSIGLSTVDDDLELPEKGEWRFSNDLKVITFRFVLNGVTRDHSAKIETKTGRLYFTVGDPDVMERVYYQKQ